MSLLTHHHVCPRCDIDWQCSVLECIGESKKVCPRCEDEEEDEG